jgi:hypothetical protein
MSCIRLSFLIALLYSGKSFLAIKFPPVTPADCKYHQLCAYMDFRDWGMNKGKDGSSGEIFISEKTKINIGKRGKQDGTKETRIRPDETAHPGPE